MSFSLAKVSVFLPFSSSDVTSGAECPISRLTTQPMFWIFLPFLSFSSQIIDHSALPKRKTQQLRNQRFPNYSVVNHSESKILKFILFSHMNHTEFKIFKFIIFLCHIMWIIVNFNFPNSSSSCATSCESLLISNFQIHHIFCHLIWIMWQNSR